MAITTYGQSQQQRVITEPKKIEDNTWKHNSDRFTEKSNHTAKHGPRE